MSIGSALFPDDHGGVQQLVAAADRGMYANKEKQKSNQPAGQLHVDASVPAVLHEVPSSEKSFPAVRGPLQGPSRAFAASLFGSEAA